MDDELSTSSLICFEDSADLDATGDSDSYTSPLLFPDAADDAYVHTLLSKERDQHRRRTDIAGAGEECECLAAARRAAVRWMLQAQASFGFAPRTALLAAGYFDGFLRRRCIDAERPWAARLLSAACLSLAAKMEESRPPAPEDMTAEFDTPTVRRMELLVLTTLEWRMSAVTPVDFLTALSGKLAGDGILRKAVKLILAAVEGGRLFDHLPSTVAAAAVLAASDGGEVDNKIAAAGRFVDGDDGEDGGRRVYDCYAALFQRRRLKRPLAAGDDDSSSPASNGSSCVTDGAGVKRTRLL